MANNFEITARDTNAISDLLRYFDPVAGRLYRLLFFRRNDLSSQLTISLKALARALHTREANVTRAKRILRAFNLIKEESSGRFGRTRYTVRPYCASTLRIIYEDNDRHLPLTLKDMYRHLKVHQPVLNDEYKLYPTAHSRTRFRRKPPVRWLETKELNLTPAVVEMTVPRYLPKRPLEAAGATFKCGTGQAATNRRNLPQAEGTKAIDRLTASFLSGMTADRNLGGRPGELEVTQAVENRSKADENKASTVSTSEILLLVNTDVFKGKGSSQSAELLLEYYWSYINFIKVTRSGTPEPAVLNVHSKLVPVVPGPFGGLPPSQDSQRSQATSQLVWIPAAKVAFLDDNSKLVCVDGQWTDYNAPQSSQEAAGRAQALEVMVGADQITIRAGNPRKLQWLYTDWKGMSAYEATYMVWETYSDATKHIKTVYPMEIPAKVQDGQGLRNKYFKLAYDWVTSHFQDWGELWFRALAGHETNAMLRGCGPPQLNIKSKPSFSWLFSNLNPAYENVRIDQFLKGRYRFSTLNPNGTAKYDWLDWHEMETDGWTETYGNPGYGDIKI